MNRVPAVLCCLATLLTGCANNAIFELTLDTPPADTREFVVVEARLGTLAEVSFEDDWQQTRITGVVLDTMNDNTFLVSFEASGDDIERELHMKVRFCASVDCTNVGAGDGNAGEVRYNFERVFYRGRYTTDSQRIEVIPTVGEMIEADDVDKCRIVGVGCREGGSPMNCLADDRHFCEAT
jgi:hypothetical protein